MAVAAIFHESGLEAGFHPHDLGEVDVAFQLALRRCLNVKIFEAISVQHHDAGFFRVRGVDQHTLGHQGLNSGAPAVAAWDSRFGVRVRGRCGGDGRRGLGKRLGPRGQGEARARQAGFRRHPRGWPGLSALWVAARCCSSDPGMWTTRFRRKHGPVKVIPASVQGGPSGMPRVPNPVVQTTRGHAMDGQWPRRRGPKPLIGPPIAMGGRGQGSRIHRFRPWHAGGRHARDRVNGALA